MVLFSKGKVWHIEFRNAKLPKHSSSQVIFRYCDMHLCTIGQKHTDSISDKLYTSLSFERFSTDAQDTSNISNFTSFQRFECWDLFAIFWNTNNFLMVPMCRLGWRMLTAFFEISHMFFWRLFSCFLCFYSPSWHPQTLGF